MLIRRFGDNKQKNFVGLKAGGQQIRLEGQSNSFVLNWRNGSKFKVQGSRNGSKFKVQGSRLKIERMDRT